MSAPIHLQGFSVMLNDIPLLAPTDLNVDRGEFLVLSGASGSGKSTLLRALCGQLPVGARRVGRIEVAGVDPFGLGAGLRAWRGRSLAFVCQDPATAMNPVLPVRRLVTELGSAGEVSRLLDEVGLPSELASRRIGELSGGQQRRVALARALARDPDLLLLDESLTGLDARSRDAVAAVIAGLPARGTTVILTCHDHEVISRLPARHVQFGGDLASPPTVAGMVERRRGAHTSAALETRGAVVRHGGSTLLRGIDLTLEPGTLTALVGPSGVGKTTFARALAGLHPATEGELLLDGVPVPWGIDRRPRHNRTAVAWVAQDPRGALTPHRRVRQVLARPLSRSGLDQSVQDLLHAVSLSPDVADRLPEQLSGGQRQRVALARALAQDPRILLADEVTSALDPGTATAVVRLLRRLAEERQIAVVMITHDLSLVAARCDRVLELRNLGDPTTGEPGESSSLDVVSQRSA